ncbi:MAG TPA: hypothetical protein VJ725_09720 [Thermoanaerobaculia bacterium]|nr:hypothetical protein [Thermoanaerobaculia bacterium]
MRQKWIFPVLTLVLGLAAASNAAAKEQYVYSVKFVCGYQNSNVGVSLDATARKEGEPSVKFGNYATEINILWPEIYLGDQQAYVFKHLTVLVDRGTPVGREPKVATAKAYVDSIQLPSLGATMDDCNRIAELLWGAVPTPYPITIGYLTLTSTHELEVTAVYTSQACSNWTSTGTTSLSCLRPDGDGSVSNSIDVEKVEGRKLLLQ